MRTEPYLFDKCLGESPTISRDRGIVEAIQDDLAQLISLMVEVNQHLGDVRMTLLGGWPEQASATKGDSRIDPGFPMARVSTLLDELRTQLLAGLAHGQVLSARVR